VQNHYSCKIHTTRITNKLIKQGVDNSFTYLAYVKGKEIFGNGLVNRFIIKSLNC
jgi:hypothetical protein